MLARNGWATRWRCLCGHENTARDRCLICDGPAPAKFLGDPDLYNPPSPPPPVYGPPVKTGTRANRTVVALIAANLALQAAEFVYFAANDVPRATAIRTSLVVGLAFYAVCAVWVLTRSKSLKLRPESTRSRWR